MANILGVIEGVGGLRRQGREGAGDEVANVKVVVFWFQNSKNFTTECQHQYSFPLNSNVMIIFLRISRTSPLLIEGKNTFFQKTS